MIPNLKRNTKHRYNNNIRKKIVSLLLEIYLPNGSLFDFKVE